MSKTTSTTYFTIMGRNTPVKAGFFRRDHGAFDPDDITKMLGIVPFNKKKKGEISKAGSPGSRYSIWEAEKSQIEGLNVEEQCLETIQRLKNKTTILMKIKEKYDAIFMISVDMNIHGEKPAIKISDEEIHKFCNMIGAKIIITDFYMDRSGNK